MMTTRKQKPLAFEAVVGYADSSDLPRLLQLDRLLYGSRALRQERWEQLLQSPSAVVLIARCRGAVVGYGVGIEQGKGVQIQSVGVHRHYRRNGTGSKLLLALAKMAPAAAAVVAEDNLVAQQWLRSCGWRAVGFERKRFGSRGDGIRFEQPQ